MRMAGLLELQAQRIAPAGAGPLRRAIDAHARIGNQTRRRRDIDDAAFATAVGQHVRQELPRDIHRRRSEEHTSELQSLMRISYAVFCLRKTTYSPSSNTAIKS